MTDQTIPTFIRDEYGYDSLVNVDWKMLRHNLRCMDNVLGDPKQFPKANVQKLSEHSTELFAFLVSHCQYFV